jgi:hypothetical protein
VSDYDRLVIEVEVTDFNADGVLEELALWEGSVLDVVTSEWMQPDVGVTFVTIPADGEMNSDSELISRTCRIVGARIIPSRDS